MTDQAPEIMIEVTGLEEKRSYRQLAVLLILVVVLTFVGLLWKTEVGCFIFLSLTLFIVRFRLPPELRRLLTVIWIIIAIALVVGIFVYRRLDTPDLTTTIANNVLLRFLIGTTWSRVFWAAVAGLLVGISLVWGPLLVVMYVSSEWLLAMRETFGVTRGQALRLLFTVVFNTNYSYYIIADGKKTLTKEGVVLKLFGGPGVVVVKPYNAVVFELGGKTTRIEGPGAFLTKLFEFPKHIIDLRPQWAPFEVEQVLTKDNVPLHIKGGIGYRIESKDQALMRIRGRGEIMENRRFIEPIKGDYPVFKFSIFSAAYRPAGPWKYTVVGMTRTQVRKALAKYELGQIFRFDPEVEDPERYKPVLNQIAEEVKKMAAEIACNWGVSVRSVNVDAIEMPEQVKQQMLEMWSAEYARRKALIEAETEKIVQTAKAEAERIVQTAKAEAREETIRVVSRGIKQLLGEGATPQDLIALRFIEYLEKAAETGGAEAPFQTQEQLGIMETLGRFGIRRDREHVEGGRE